LCFFFILLASSSSSFSRAFCFFSLCLLISILSHTPPFHHTFKRVGNARGGWGFIGEDNLPKKKSPRSGMPIKTGEVIVTNGASFPPTSTTTN
jgi:hypothetical protein